MPWTDGVPVMSLTDQLDCSALCANLSVNLVPGTVQRVQATGQLGQCTGLQPLYEQLLKQSFILWKSIDLRKEYRGKYIPIACIHISDHV